MRFAQTAKTPGVVRGSGKGYTLAGAARVSFFLAALNSGFDPERIARSCFGAGAPV